MYIILRVVIPVKGPSRRIGGSQGPFRTGGSLCVFGGWLDDCRFSRVERGGWKSGYFGYGEMGWAAASVGFLFASLLRSAYAKWKEQEDKERRRIGREGKGAPSARLRHLFWGIRYLRLRLWELGPWSLLFFPSLGGLWRESFLGSWGCLGRGREGRCCYCLALCLLFP